MNNQHTPKTETETTKSKKSATAVTVNDRMFFTRDEACKVLNIGRGKFYQLVNNKELIARSHANRTVVLKQDIESYLNNLPKLKEQEPEADAA